MSEVNKTEEQHHTWTDEQIHILLSTVADLHQRVASLENGSKQIVSIEKLRIFVAEYKYASGHFTYYLLSVLEQ